MESPIMKSKSLFLLLGSLALAMVLVASLGPANILVAQAPQQAAPAANRGGEKPPAPPEPPPAVMPPGATPIISGTAPNPDPRVGLKAGRWDAGQAAWNMRLVSTTPPSEASLGS